MPSDSFPDSLHASVVGICPPKQKGRDSASKSSENKSYLLAKITCFCPWETSLKEGCATRLWSEETTPACLAILYQWWELFSVCGYSEHSSSILRRGAVFMCPLMLTPYFSDTWVWDGSYLKKNNSLYLPQQSRWE